MRGKTTTTATAAAAAAAMTATTTTATEAIAPPPPRRVSTSSVRPAENTPSPASAVQEKNQQTLVVLDTRSV